MERTIYDNGRHRIGVERNGNTGRLGLIVHTNYNKAAGRTQWPIRYDDGTIGYDTPEIVPNYVRRIVWGIFNNKSRKYAGIADYENLIA